MNTTAAANFAAGNAAAIAAIAILEQSQTPETMRLLASQNIIAIHATKFHGDYEHGASQAWSDWQAASTRKIRQGRRW